MLQESWWLSSHLRDQGKSYQVVSRDDNDDNDDDDDGDDDDDDDDADDDDNDDGDDDDDLEVLHFDWITARPCMAWTLTPTINTVVI